MNTAKIYLETDRIRMREFTMDDIDLLVDLDSDPAVTRYINGGLPTPREEVERIMPRIFEYYEKHPGQGVWVAENRETEEFMGWFHLRPNRAAEEETELGYRLKQRFWGQGFGTEGSLALIRKGFEELGSSIVVAIADPENGASRRVMEKAGLKFLEEYAEPDGFIVVKYGVTRENWSGGPGV